LGEGGPYEEQELMYLFDVYGASPRELSMTSGNPDALHEVVVEQVMQMTLPAIRTALGSSDVDYSSHHITRIEPSHNSRGIAEKTIASQFILKLLWDKYMKDQ